MHLATWKLDARNGGKEMIDGLTSTQSVPSSSRLVSTDSMTFWAALSPCSAGYCTFVASVSPLSRHLASLVKASCFLPT